MSYANPDELIAQRDACEHDFTAWLDDKRSCRKCGWEWDRYDFVADYYKTRSGPDTGFRYVDHLERRLKLAEAVCEAVSAFDGAVADTGDIDDARIATALAAWRGEVER